MADTAFINMSGSDSANNAAVTTSKEKRPSFSIVLPKGKCGWFVMVASLLCLLVSDGILFCFGLIASDSDHIFYKSTGKKVLFFACVRSTTFASGFAVSKFGKQNGLPTIMIAKTVLSFVGLLAYSMSQAFGRLLFVLVAMVFGISDTLPTISIVVERDASEWPTLSTGIALCYSGTGALVFGPFTYYLYDKFAITETYYYMTGFYLVSALFGWLYVLYTNLRRKKLPEDVALLSVATDETPNSNEIESHQNQGRAQEQPNNGRGNPGNQKQQNGSDPITIPNILGHFINSLRKILLLKSETFIALSFASFLQAFGLFVPMVYLSAHAINMKTSKVEAYFLISAIGISSTIGRIFNGRLCSNPNFKVLYWNNCGLAVTGVLILSCSISTSYWWLVVFSLLFGLASSCTVVSHPIVLAKELALKNATEGYGVIHTCYRAGAFVCFLLSGWLYKFCGHYWGFFTVVGCLVFLSAFLCWCLKKIKHWEGKKFLQNLRNNSPAGMVL